MIGRGRYFGFILAVVGWAAAGGEASGEDGFFRWFQPLSGGPKTAVAVRGGYYPRREVRDQGLGFEESRSEASLLIPLVPGPDREWSAAVRAGLRAIRTRALLPDSGTPLPSELWDLRLGVIHRRRWENGWILGGNLALASPSDRPFAGWDETAINFNGFLRLPSGRTDAWVFFLNYSSTREFLPHVPIPGAGYLHSPSRNFSALIGVPLLFLNWSPTADLTLRGFYFPIHTVFLGGEYRLGGGWKLFSSWSWENDRYYRAEREDKAHRLFWYEQRLEGGLAFAVGGGIELTLAGGWAWDRFFFEGKSYSENRTDNRVDISDGPFLTARCGGRF